MFVEKRMEAQKTHKTCAIYKCGNRMAPIFRFPHPKRGLDRFMAWVKASNNPKFEGLTNDQIYRRGYICYQHFRAEDYVQGTQRLHQSAVPTILPPRGKNKLKVRVFFEECGNGADQAVSDTRIVCGTTIVL